MKSIIKICVFSFLLFSASEKVLADGFEINLYYNSGSGKLNFDQNADKDVTRNIEADTSIVEYSKDKTAGAFVLKLYDDNNREFSSHEFDGKGGSFKLVIPYFSIAKELKIFKKSVSLDNEILKADLSEYMSCNGNGICEVSLGENNSNCLGDCSTKPQTSVLGIEGYNGSIPDYEKSSSHKEENKAWYLRILDFFKNLF